MLCIYTNSPCLTFNCLDTSIRERKAYKYSDDPEYAIYDPFGKGGGGAPMKDEYGTPRARRMGALERDDVSQFYMSVFTENINFDNDCVLL